MVRSLLEEATGQYSPTKARAVLKDWYRNASPAVEKTIARLRKSGLNEMHKDAIRMARKQRLVGNQSLSENARVYHHALFMLSEEIEDSIAQKRLKDHQAAAKEREKKRALERQAEEKDNLVRVVERTGFGKGGSETRIVYLPRELV